MRAPRNHRLFVPLLSVFLVSTALAGGPSAALRGRPDRLGSTADVGAGQPAALSGKGAQATRTVQVPGLQAPANVPAAGNPVAVVSTTLGDITLELFKDRAPVSVENFLQYAAEGFYAGTIFHRVKKGFMIQGGGYTASLVEKPTRPPIQNEATNGLRNLRGTVGVARRATLRSGTSQFYINVVDNRSLDHTGYSPDQFGYAVFGRVLEGMDIVDRIVAVDTRTTADMEDVPIEPVIIKSVRAK
jgi:cyclophilin family peptidyl-prolyl cis-trans isomerase